MKVILGDKCGILLGEYLPGGPTISGPYYALIIERLEHCAIVEKRRRIVVLLDDGNAPVDKCNIV